MNGKYDVITVGNATIDIFLTVHDTNKHFRINEQTKELCVKHGDKVLVDATQFLLGGNACNVAIGLQKLGLKTAITAEIGTDEFSQKILKGLKSKEVGQELIVKSVNEITPFSLILNYKKERTIFTENTEKEHNFNFGNCLTDWIYLTSLGKKWMDAYRNTLEFAKKTGAKLIFNPGAAQIDAGENHVANVLSHSEILIVNKQEAEKMTNGERHQVEELLKDLRRLKPSIVVITDGPNGAYCIDRNEQIYYQEAMATEIVERTGAGDAFSTGFLAAIINDKTIKEAMLWGAKNAASVVARIGAQQGLLTKKEIEN